MADCENVFVEGLTALIDLAGTYNGYNGRLYPGPSNSVPAAHDAEADAAALAIVRRDTAGNPSGSGVILMVGAGMSNTRQEFSEFQRTPSNKASYVKVINGAQTAQDASVMATAVYWDVVDDEIEARGYTAAQVGAVWLKTAESQESGSFPTHMLTLKGYLKGAVEIIAARYDNCKIVFLSSRTYGGYNDTGVSPEPWAYEGGFAVQQLIADQVNGTDLDLDYSLVPVLLWGPYLWANGTTGNSEGLSWVCSDFEGDGVHPSATGEAKVAAKLVAFFEDEANSHVAWFVGAGGAGVSSQGPNSPDIGEDNSGVGTIAWTDPGNVLASDDVNRATATLLQNEISHYLLARDFDFTIPAGATIDGVEAKIERHATMANSVKDLSVKLYVGGAISGNEKADTGTFYPTSDAIATYGGAADLWGLTPAVAQVNAADFGFALACTNVNASSRTARVDHMTVTVYYTEAAGAGRAYASRSIAIATALAI